MLLCKLHNICIDDFGKALAETVTRISIPGFTSDNDHQIGDRNKAITFREFFNINSVHSKTLNNLILFNVA